MKSILRKHNIVFFLIIAIAFLYSTLSIQKYFPSTRDAYVNIGTTAIVSIAILYALYFIKIRYINITSLFFLYFAILIAIQPIFNQITYLDNLIFPVFSLLIVAILSIIVINIKEYSNNCSDITIIMLAIIVSSILLVCSQIVQLLDIEWLIGELVFYSEKDRLTSNLAQPNQAAYVMSMGIACCGYFWLSTNKKLFQYLSISMVIFLGMGIGFSVSRGGVLLGIAAILILALFTRMQNRERILFLVLFLSCFFLGNYLGGEILSNYGNSPASNLERFSENSLSLRVYLNQEAWLIFKNHWLFGVGWDNFAKAGLEYAEQLKWFTNANHSHFFVTQIAAELGVIGLTGLMFLGVILIKSIKINSSPENSVLLAIVGLGILYSCSEYPMWYFRYLFLFALFLSFLDKSKIKISLNVSPVLKVFMILTFLGSSYYYLNYSKYSKVAYFIFSDENTSEEKEMRYQSLPNIFGFSDYKEFFVFVLMPISEKQATEKAIIGSRIVSKNPYPPAIYKQPAILAVNHQFDEALVMFKAACLHEFARNCDYVENELKRFTEQRPDLFSDIYKKFTSWRQEYPEKTNLKEIEPTSAEPTSAEPTSAELTSAEPTSAEPTSVEPTSVEPMQT